MYYLHVTKKLLSDHQAAALLAPHGSFTRHLIVSLYNRFPQQMLQHFVSHFILIGSVHQPQTWGWLRKIVLAKSHVLPFIIGAPDNQSKWPGNDFWCRKSNVCWFISDLIATSAAVIYYAGERHPELHSDGRVWHLFVNLPADAGCEPFMQCVNVRVIAEMEVMAEWDEHHPCPVFPCVLLCSALWVSALGWTSPSVPRVWESPWCFSYAG